MMTQIINKNIFTTSDNSSKPSNKIYDKDFEKYFIPNVPQIKDKQQPIIINSSVNCVDKKYIDEIEKGLTKDVCWICDGWY